MAFGRTLDADGALAGAARPLRGERGDYDELIERIGEARFVLIGEASHGTHEFYEIRALLTQRLIEERGFQMVVVEADWPDASRVNRYVRGCADDADATEALGGFTNFPQWMWRNTVVLDFVGWLRDHNERVGGEGGACGFYGMDLYTLHASMNAVIAYLDGVDAKAAQRARERYECFEAFGPEPATYARGAGLGLDETCESEVVAQLVDLRRSAAAYAQRDGRLAEDELFEAEQNARLVKNAEAYYRTMMAGHVESWNRRDEHMVETLAALADFQGRRLAPEPARMVVWAHNSHLGDARATEMSAAGEVNVGQLARERFGHAKGRHAGQGVFNIGFSTYAGTVTAANDWGGPAERMEVNPGLAESYEALLHRLSADGPGVMLFPPDAAAVLTEERLQRAIGVIYRPARERMSHYFHARLAEQFDAMIHVDRTRAVEPLERMGTWTAEAETYPSGV